jgi:hypothetical protein
MTVTSQDVAKVVTAIVEEAVEILGSRLAAELRKRIPEWAPQNFGCRNLREFVSRHVIDVAVSRRAGMDVRYVLSGPGSSDPEVRNDQGEEADFWRAWVSPNSPVALIIERAGGGIRLVPRKFVPPDGELLVEPPSVGVHKEIATSFLENVPDSVADLLKAALEAPDAIWWQAWKRTLGNTEYLHQWTVFRRNRLEGRLETQLRQVGIEQTKAAEILQRVRKTQTTTRANTSQNGTLDLSPNDAATTALRRLIIGAVQHMDAKELREIRLPLGLVLDLLAKPKSR